MSAEISLENWILSLNSALEAKNAQAASALFWPQGFWRDLIAFSWSYRTLEGQARILALWQHHFDTAGSAQFFGGAVHKAEGDRLEAWITFETALGRGSGMVKLVKGRAEVLLTKLDDLKGHEEPLRGARPKGIAHHADKSRVTWREARDAKIAAQPHSAEVLIVGGSQGGLGLAARLGQLGIPYLLVEQTPRLGDNWRNRYRTLVLHDPVWYDHMPYLPFPDHWPVFTPKDKMGDWLEHYADIMEIDAWTSTRATSAQYDGARWQVTLEREGSPVTLSPRFVVFATGAYGPPRKVAFKGQDDFGGPVLHSSAFTDGAAFAGKRVAVIGSASSAHDVCVSLWESGARPLMIQRHPTTVVRSETLMEMAFGDYSQEAVDRGLTTEKADLLGAAMPHKLLVEDQIALYKKIAERDADFYAALEGAGFDLDFGVDGSGQMIKALRTASGYYLDVGGSQLIIDGEIEVIAKDEISHLSQGTLHFASGRTEAVDAIIACTGYGSMHEIVAQVVDQETADLVGPCWGVGSGTRGDPAPFTGELRNMWQPTAHPALWFHGGNLAMSRFNSKLVALQLKARLEGLPTPIFD